jgi:broad specificity phosphatase PhoE
MRIFLLRHGATDWNLAGKCQGLTDVELNAAGRAQAEAAAELLAGEAVAAIYSSRLTRARGDRGRGRAAARP